MSPGGSGRWGGIRSKSRRPARCIIIGTAGTRGASRHGANGVIIGTLPGILFRVRPECVRGVNFKQRF